MQNFTFLGELLSIPTTIVCTSLILVMTVLEWLKMEVWWNSVLSILHTILIIIISIFLEVSTFVGSQAKTGFTNSHGIDSQFNRPVQLVYSNKSNSFLVADMGNNAIREITMDGIMCEKSNCEIY